jgi:ankyrin repeat protein
MRPPLTETDEKFDEKAGVVRLLIQNGADVTARDETNSTPLHLASSKGSGETVDLLIRCGADVNAYDGRHLTPLHLAASSRLASDGDIVRLLLSHGANGEALDDKSRTPFQIALTRGLSKIAQLLSDCNMRGE